MGTGHSYRCKCRKTNKHINVGIGMMYPRVCDRIQENMLAGEYGDVWKTFLEEHPGGAFDGERLVYKCSACEYWELDYKKDYYMTMTGEPAEHNYVMWFDRYFRKYRCVRRFRHMCPECQRNYMKLPNNTLILTKEPFVGFMPADLRACIGRGEQSHRLLGSRTR